MSCVISNDGLSTEGRPTRHCDAGVDRHVLEIAKALQRLANDLRPDCSGCAGRGSIDFVPAPKFLEKAAPWNG